MNVILSAIKPIKEISIIKKIQTLLSRKIQSNPTLTRDTFVKESENTGEVLTRKINSRTTPNYIGTENDIISGVGGQIHFYPEDIDKMKKMSPDKANEYKTMLIVEGRFIETPASFNVDELL